MAFNFMAALGGFGKQVSENIESAKEFQREKEFKLELLAEEEATKMRLARASERRAAREKDAENLAFLQSMGYSPTKAAWIMKGGSSAISKYADWGGKAVARGISPDVLLGSKQFGDDANDPRNEAALSSMAGSDRVGEGFDLNFEQLSAALGDLPKEPDIYSSIAEGHASTFSRLQNEKNKKNPDQDVITMLTEDLAEWAEKLDEDIKKRDTSEKPDVKYFTDGSRPQIVSNAKRDALRDQDFQTDLEGNITSKMEGREGQRIIANLNAADSIMSQAQIKKADGSIVDTDWRLYNEGNQLLEKAERNLTTYGQGQVQSKDLSKTPNKYSYVKNETKADGSFQPIAINQAIENSRRGMYKAGDVIIVAKKENNVVVQKVLVYTDRKSLEDQGVEVNGTTYYNMFHDAGMYNN